MSKTTTRSFNEFLASSGNSGVKKIALAYANSDDDMTIEELAKNNNLTKYGINQLFEYAIVHFIVTYQDAIKMQLKAHRNQVRHMDEEHQTSSDKKYSRLLDKRLDFIRNGFDDEKVKHIVNVYLRSSNISAEQISRSLGLSKKELNLILKKAIIANIIDDNKLKELTEVTLRKVNNSFKRDQVYNTLKNFEAKRKRFRHVSSELIELYFKVETSDDSDFENEGVDLIDLRQQIDNLEEEYFSFFKNL